jgi:ribosomal protein S18 acetylase RimI-like enzyme
MVSYLTSRDILHDLSPPALAAAVESNLFALFDTFQALPNAEFQRKPELTWFATKNLLNPMFNGVAAANLDSQRVDDTITETLAQFRANHIPTAFWWLGPSTYPSDLDSHLIKHGLNLFENAPGMAVELTRIHENIPAPADFRISVVESEDDLNEWGATFNYAYDAPDFAGQSWVDASLGFGLNTMPWRLYLGWLDDIPVAVSMLFCGGGVAGIYNIGTMQEVRREGIGSLMTLQPLLDAREMGYRAGVLFASELGFGVYKRLGFEQVCTISRYLWRGR